MMALLRNRAALITLAVVLVLGLRLVPLPAGSGAGPGQPGAGAGSQPGVSQRESGRAAPSPTPATLDPDRLQGQAQPFLVLRASTVKRGAPLVIGGQSFRPYQELVISLKRRGESQSFDVGTASADKNGFLQDVSLPLPEHLAAGAYTVVAAPPRGGFSVEADLEVEPSDTWARLTSATAKPNEAVGFEGGGFAPGERVNIYLDSLASAPVAGTVASAGGDILGSFRVPLADEGDHIILLYGDRSRVPAMVDLNIQGFHPWVVLDNYSPQPEQPVGFSGSDFTPYERVYVFLNSLESRPVAVVRVAEDGTFKAPGALPLGPEVKGTQKLLFVGDHSQSAAEAEFTVQPYPAALQLTVYAGPPGSQVAFVGTGFARGETIHAYVGRPGASREVSTFETDAQGSFAGAGGFRIPRDTKAGDLPLTVVGEVSGAEATVAFAVLPIEPWGEASQNESSQVVVVGHGFALGEAVDLMLGQAGEKPVATVAADINGNAQFAPLDLPDESSGAIAMRLRGRESGGEARFEFYASPPAEGGGESGEGRGRLEFEQRPPSEDD